MTTYTILLARPDYIANDSLDTYLICADGDTPQAAVDAARAEACKADDCDPEQGIDYAPLIVIAGEHDDLSYLIDNEGVK